MGGFQRHPEEMMGPLVPSDPSPEAPAGVTDTKGQPCTWGANDIPEVGCLWPEPQG